jgi:hypothetical protein
MLAIGMISSGSTRLAARARRASSHINVRKSNRIEERNDMKKRYGTLTSLIPALLLLVSCTNASPSQQDLINDPFPEAQAEIREVVMSIVKDAMTANIEGLRAAHLVSDKFTKFGPRSFDRQDVASTNESEGAYFSSISDFKQEVRDLKIDVFGEIGIATYYPHVSFVQDGQEKTGGRLFTNMEPPSSDGPMTRVFGLVCLS